MKCWSRSTLGIVIGILNIVGYIIAIIALIVIMVMMNTQEDMNEKVLSTFNIVFSILIVICVALTPIPVLMVRGILMRRYKLMIPWLIIAGIGFVSNCGIFIFQVISLIAAGVPFTTVIIVIVVGVGGIALSALILWPIYTLYVDIRKENIEDPNRHMSAASQVEYQPPPYSDKK